MRETKRTLADDGQSFTELTVGDAPSSAEVSINAKGQAQVSIKVYCDSAGELKRAVANDIGDILAEFERVFEAMRIPMAWRSGESEARR